MARILILFALCVLPAFVSAARPLKNPLVLQGRVYCDTCRAGFETSATTYIEGAKVRVECKDRKSQELVYSVEGETDSTGTYEITVADDHKEQVCETVLVSSPQSNCASVVPGRERARVILTCNNGMDSNKRYANNLGFMKDEALEGCTELLKQYNEEEV